MKAVRYLAWAGLLILAFPLACWVAFVRGRRRGMNRSLLRRVDELATRPIYGRR